MQITVEFIPTKRTKKVELEEGATGMTLVEQLSLTPDSVILARSSSPIPIDEPLNDGEKLTLISVVSGG